MSGAAATASGRRLGRLARQPAALLGGTLALAALFCFWGLGSQGVRMWDETRYAENAFQMLQSGDYLNYVYDGRPDDWVAKPPLGIWLVALSYRLFGFNELALRVPSALCGVGAILLTFQLVRLYRGVLSAAFAGIVLITCRGVIGMHVARTGDLDGLYLVTALGMIYCVARYTRRGEPRALLAAAACAGLCFYAKGFMLLMALPGLGLFVLMRGKLRSLLAERYLYLAAGLFAAVVASWYVIVKRYGQTFPGGNLGHDAWETMVMYDIWRRYTEKIEGDNTTAAFTLSALDTRFGPWIYLLYLSLGLLAVRGRGRLRAAWAALRHDELLCLCVAVVVSTVAILTNSQTKFNWYYAIAVPFLAVLTMLTFRRAARGRRWLWPVLAALTAGALGMQAYFCGHRENTLTDQIAEQRALVAGAMHVYYLAEAPPYNAALALKWRHKHLEPAPGGLAGAPRERVTDQISLVREAGGYSLVLAAKP